MGGKKTCVIIQPSYLPWRGYFDLIRDADVFVFHDDVQYTKQDWRNRNRIKTPGGPVWLTVPVGTVPTDTPINRVAISDPSFAKTHLNLIRENYRKAPHFKAYDAFFSDFFATPWHNLSEMDVSLTVAIARHLKIGTRFFKSSEMGITGQKTERILQICALTGADHYLSGPSAADYIDERALRENGIRLSYKSYDYPPYPQLHGGFEPRVSILDLLFNCGPDSQRYIWGHRA